MSAASEQPPKKLSFKDMLLKGVEEDEENQKKGIVSSVPAIGARPGQEPAAAAKVPKVTKVDQSESPSTSTTTPASTSATTTPSRADIEKATATVHHQPGDPSIHTYILDAGPLLSQTFSDLQKHALHFYTTPAVLHTEVRDARSRQNVELWKAAGALDVRQPSPKHINAVTEFAKKTGDFAVLSTNDIHILALAREMDVELHGGSDAHLRKGPGSETLKKQKDLANANLKEGIRYNIKVEKLRPGQEEEKEEEQEKKDDEDDGWAVVTKKKGKKSFKYQNSTQSQDQPQSSPVNELVSKMGGLEVTTSMEEEEEESEDGWITQDNIMETMRKDQYEPEESSFMAAVKKPSKAGDVSKLSDNGSITSEAPSSVVTSEEPTKAEFIPVAVSTGDFAMQNVALQMGLNLVSPVDGKYIKQVKNHMLRCHACFHLCPIPRTNDVGEIMNRRQHGNQANNAAGAEEGADGESKKNKKYVNASLSSSVMGRGFNFCPECGAAGTLKRCTVRVNGKDGHIHVYLKRNMQWSTRGNVFQLPATQSRKARRATRTKDPYNFSGSRSNGESGQLILREDQVEYERAIVHDYKLKRHNEKVLEDWIGGSIGGGGDVSAGNVSVPFAYHRDAARHTGVKIGPGGRVAGSGNRAKR